MKPAQLQEEEGRVFKRTTSIQQEERPENNPYSYKHHGDNTYYIPVYPRAFVEEVINIDNDRRTVTAKFVLMVTVCIKVNNDKLRDFLKNHLILEFGYNQTLFIPEHITLENSPFLISRVAANDKDDYVTYKIIGTIECDAYFDCMFFPYRRIEVVNHLCIREQEFNEERDGTFVKHVIRYNTMMLMEENQIKSGQEQIKTAQFLPYSGNKNFGDYKIDNFSSKVIADVSPHVIQQHLDIPEVIRNIFQIAYDPNSKKEINKKWQIESAEDEVRILSQQQIDQLEPYQHIAFRFTMSSFSVGFVWQQEVPLWVLSLVSLFLFEAQPNIGNKYSSVILLLVSYVSVISNFRRNNIAQQTLTIYQVKLMLLTIVPILLIITTAIDYYNTNLFEGRSNQVSNPFAIASLLIVIGSLVFTLAYLFVLWITRFVCEPPTPKAPKDDLIDWVNMIELEWGHHKLNKSMKNAVMQSGDKNVFTFHNNADPFRELQVRDPVFEMLKQGMKMEPMVIRPKQQLQEAFS